MIFGKPALLRAHSTPATVSFRSVQATLWNASAGTGITPAARVPRVEQRFIAKAVSYARYTVGDVKVNGPLMTAVSPMSATLRQPSELRVRRHPHDPEMRAYVGYGTSNIGGESMVRSSTVRTDRPSRRGSVHGIYSARPPLCAQVL